MNITAYIKKYLGKFVDFDGHYGYQCVDLIRHYVKTVYGESLGTSWPTFYAKDWFFLDTSFPKWNRIDNNPDNPDQIPKPGDIIFFDGGTIGHVAFVNESFPGENRIDVIEQNAAGGKGAGVAGDEIRVTKYRFTGNNGGMGSVLGWYTRKDGNQPTDYTESLVEKKEVKEKAVVKIDISKELKAIETNINSIKTKVGI